jgi:hypothetical protein
MAPAYPDPAARARKIASLVMHHVHDGKQVAIATALGVHESTVSRLPLASADSTNIGQNVGIDSAWRGPYTPASKDMRALVMRTRIESHQAMTLWNRAAEQGALL